MKSNLSKREATDAVEVKAERESPTPVKLGALRARADRAALKIGSNRSAVIRLALICVLPDIERGVVRLPAGRGA